MAKQDAKQDTKQSKTPPVAAKVPEEAVGEATIETKQPSGETTVQTVPASQAKQEVTPAVNWNSSPTAEKPRRAKRQTREQRKRSREEQIERRKAIAAAPRAVPTPGPEETRTIEITLPARMWERFDRQMQRSNQDAAAYIRRLLAPQLR